MVLISLVSVLNLLYSTFTSVLSEVCVQCPIWLFYGVLDLCFPGMLLTYFLNDFEIVPVAPIITGIIIIIIIKV